MNTHVITSMLSLTQLTINTNAMGTPKTVEHFYIVVTAFSAYAIFSDILN